MKVSAKGSGGWCGASQCYDIDTTNLENGKAIERLVAQLDFGAPHPETIGADLLRWQVTVDDGGVCRSTEFVDDGSGASAPWHLLLAQIRAGQT
ncbi:MAG: hypothetical protein V4723_21670 [Pseudomonadota bacterium]